MGLQPKVRSDQLAAVPGTTVPLAAQACAPCRKQKRRCDKLLPACSRCASLQRACDYAEAAAGASAAPTAEDFAALQSKLVEIEARLLGGGGGGASNVQNPTPAERSSNAGSWSDPNPRDDAARSSSWTSGRGGGGGGSAVINRFPSVFFLDTDIYKFAGISPPKPIVDIPMVS